MTGHETISIGEWHLIKGTGKLRTCGLGSCVGVVLFDKKKKLAGMVHIMLPDSKKARKGKLNPWRYADTALELLHNQLLEAGAIEIGAKLAGGAQMFKYAVQQEFMQIGERNILAVLQVLEALHIPVVATDTGGTNGRTIEFDVVTSELVVRTVNKRQTII
ncbi:chemotaxis protein CheD [Bacillus sp. JCM 19041]|uniref:chemotaxis protein CheD n=1 Tax=Bacillus sp. JCM 19041 TaxID=1460637 RepID=UPI0006CF7202